MKFLKLYESYIQFPIVLDETIEDENDGYIGSVLAVIHNDTEHLINALQNQGAETIFEYLLTLSNLFPICILKNINVEEEYRGNNYGNELYNIVENFSIKYKCSYMLLVSDSDETQEDGFVLDNWYLYKGYNIIGKSGRNNILMKKIK